MQNFIIKITQENAQLLEKAEIGCFILPTNLSSQFTAEFIDQAHSRNKLVLCAGENAVEFYHQFNTDGLILNTVAENSPQKLIKQVELFLSGKQTELLKQIQLQMQRQITQKLK